MFNINVKRVYEDNVFNMPPWNENVHVILNYDKTSIYNQTFLEYLSIEFPNFKYCYTDGSKNNGADAVIGSAMFFSHLKLGWAYRLHPGHSVIFSEAFAIRKA